MEEHMNMDAAKGSMPPPAVPNKLKQKPPKGELNPYAKHVGTQAKARDIQEKHASGRDMEEAQLRGNWAEGVSLLPSGRQKQAMIAEEALAESAKVSEEELIKRDKQLFQTWIQQNPVQAAMLGIDKDDPFEEKKGKSPMTYYKNSPLKAVYGQSPGINQMSRAQAFAYGRQANTNPMATAGVAGGQLLQEKLAQWDKDRQEYKEKLKAQKDREAKDMLEASKPLMQTLDNSQALDEAGKNLLAQQWKQAYVENEKKYKAGEIDQYDYALNKAQSLNNAQQYQQTVGNLNQKAQEFAELLKNGQLSDATTEEARDFYTSMAGGKGMNIQKTEDGKTVANPGMTIQNVNGTPTMVGWTQGQVDQARQAYQQLTQPQVDQATGLEIPPKLTPEQTSFEAFLGSVPRPGDPNFEQQKQDPMYAKWIDGVNIPIANLASMEGMPEIVAKDPAFDQNLTAYVDDVAQKALNSIDRAGAYSIDQMWDQASAYASEYADQMIQQMPETSVRAIAADYLDMTPTDIRNIMDNEGGFEALKKQMVQPLTEAMKLRFQHNPELERINKKYVDEVYARARQSNAANLRGTGRGRAIDTELAQQQAQDLANGNYRAFLGTVGRDKLTKIEEIKPGFWDRTFGEPPKEKVYEVEINGEPQEMPESELKSYLMRTAGIKGSMMGRQTTGGGAKTAADKIAEIRARRAQGSPTQKKKSPLKALPLDNPDRWHGMRTAYADKHGMDAAIKKFGESFQSFQKMYKPEWKGKELDSVMFGITDDEHEAGIDKNIAERKADLNKSSLSERDQANIVKDLEDRAFDGGELRGRGHTTFEQLPEKEVPWYETAGKYAGKALGGIADAVDYVGDKVEDYNKYQKKKRDHKFDSDVRWYMKQYGYDRDVAERKVREDNYNTYGQN